MSDAAGWVLLAGRIVFAFFFVFAGFRHVVGGTPFVQHAQAAGFPLPVLAGWPSGLWLVVGGLSVAVGVWPDIGVLMIAAFLVPAAIWFHAFWKKPAEQQMMDMQLFFRNVTFIGACIALFACFAAVDEGLRFAVTGSLIDLD